VLTDGRDSRMVSVSNEVVRGGPRCNLSATALLSKDRPDLSLVTVGRGPRHSYCHGCRMTEELHAGELE
jgi:hypothetical protein